MKHNNTSPLQSSREKEQFILDDQQLASIRGGVEPISPIPTRQIKSELAATLGFKANDVPHGGDIPPRISAPAPDSSRRLNELKQELPKFKRTFSTLT